MLDLPSGKFYITKLIITKLSYSRHSFFCRTSLLLKDIYPSPVRIERGFNLVFLVSYCCYHFIYIQCLASFPLVWTIVHRTVP